MGTRDQRADLKALRTVSQPSQQVDSSHPKYDRRRSRSGTFTTPSPVMSKGAPSVPHIQSSPSTPCSWAEAMATSTVVTRAHDTAFILPPRTFNLELSKLCLLQVGPSYTMQSSAASATDSIVPTRWACRQRPCARSKNLRAFFCLSMNFD